MLDTTDTTTVCTATNLQDFFRTELSHVVENHHIELGEDSLWYLTQLLYNYRRSEIFFDYNANGGTLTPLAEYYRQAAEAATSVERKLHLQRLGDVSLFVSSLFSGALKRKPIDVGYYMSMGESAYSCLANSSVRSSRDRALASVFEELSESFEKLVNAIADIAVVRSNNSHNLLNLVLEWEQTQCPRLARRLEASGVVLSIGTPTSH